MKSSSELCDFRRDKPAVEHFAHLFNKQEHRRMMGGGPESKLLHTVFICQLVCNNEKPS